MANSADPDQMADLDLHCLQRQGISGFSRTRFKCKTYNHQTKHVYSVITGIIGSKCVDPNQKQNVASGKGLYCLQYSSCFRVDCLQSSHNIQTPKFPIGLLDYH